ncbi:hypothetical protein JL49_25145 [Pseudoalteromonas luteoviolacea]|nr:hypothetical protein JL49_25145 [Pseudoalteromonas luteoviolacea]
MLTTIQTIESQQIAEDLKKIEAVYTGENFLSGLFLNSRLPDNLEGFRVYNDVKCIDMRIETSGDYYDNPDNYPFRHFPDILEDESGRITYRGVYSFDEAMNIQDQYEGLVNQFTSKFGKIVDNALAVHLDDSTYSKIAAHADMPTKHVQWLFERCLSYVVHSNFIMMVDAAVLGGLENSPISQRILDCYRLGGMPGGWVGPMPEDGGLAKDCIELYHLGSK